MALRILAAKPSSQLLALPWHLPLEEWPDDCQVPLARGISRHVVRFVRVDHEVYAAKETRESWAWREYGLLRNLRRLDLPTVEPVGVVTGRVTEAGTELEPCLLTRHLPHSLPYRALFSQRLRPETIRQVVDALVVLLVRLHVEGFWWGDCSLSNTLFRRSAGEFAAYLVDAETGELHARLSDGQRAHDLDLVQTNVYGELLDLEAGDLLSDEVDPEGLVQRIADRYDDLWGALTGVEEFDTAETWRFEQRIHELNELGFDVEELDIVTDWDGASVRIQPAVVEAGHHRRRLQGLTGLDVEEPQARRLLNDLDTFTAAQDLQGEDPMIVAHRWLTLGVRAVVGDGAGRAARPARTRRAVPRGARAPLVPVPGEGCRGGLLRRGALVHRGRAAAALADVVRRRAHVAGRRPAGAGARHRRRSARLMSGDARGAYADAATWFVSLVRQVDGRWDEPGLGSWSVRDLVGHTSRALLTVESYLREGPGPVEAPSAVDYFLRSREALADAEAVAERGRQAGAALGDDPPAAVAVIAERVLALVAAAGVDDYAATPVGDMWLSRLPAHAYVRAGGARLRPRGGVRPAGRRAGACGGRGRRGRCRPRGPRRQRGRPAAGSDRTAAAAARLHGAVRRPAA